VAHALHVVISSGKWKNYSTDGSQISQNGDAILEHLKKVSLENETQSRKSFFQDKDSIQRFKLANLFDYFRWN